jgi:hypothetical protein
MAELPRDFSERLLAREEVDAMRLQQLRDQIDAVLEIKLTRAGRVAGYVGGLLMIVGGLAPLAGLRARWDELPPMALVMIAAGVIGVPWIGVVLILIARRGVYDVRQHSKQLLVLAMWLCLGVGTTFLHFGWSSGDGEAVFGGTLVLAVGAGGFLFHVLEQYHLLTKRKLLELELRLAELAERIDRSRPS